MLTISLIISSLTKIIKEWYKLIKTLLTKTQLHHPLPIGKIHSVTLPNLLTFLESLRQGGHMIKDLKALLSLRLRKMKKFSIIPSNKKMDVQQCYLHQVKREVIKLLFNKKLPRSNKLKKKSRE